MNATVLEKIEGNELDWRPLPTAHRPEANGEMLRPLPPEEWPRIDHIITEDDTPVDNIYSEKQQRLLTHPLYASWSGPGGGRPFVALANVGLFASVSEPAIVPDVLVSLGVRLPDDIWEKRHRSYFIWEYGKPPEVVVEIVSNRVGGEDGVKMDKYGRMGVQYYVIYDPEQQLSDQALRIFHLSLTTYFELNSAWLSGVGLRLTLWRGVFEDREDTWLRWCDNDGNILLTGEERAEQERQRAIEEGQRAEQERSEKEQAQRQVQLLLAQLRALGVDPELGSSSQ